MNARSGSDALVKAMLSVGDASLRATYVASVARVWPVERLADALDELCRRAERADTDARETLVAVVDALNDEGMSEIVGKLREQAACESLLALERLIRRPASLPPSLASAVEPHRDAGRLPAGHGPPQSSQRSTLTLGERKWLARRPDRETLQRLLADPHPDVIRRCLRNPRLTEEDLIPLASKRPGRSQVLTEIARSRWAHRPRIRLSLVLNPWTPFEIAARMAGLLLRHELQAVAQASAVPASVRALCLEHLARRPPFASRGERGEGGVH
jgi:hypothetical protein